MRVIYKFPINDVGETELEEQFEQLLDIQYQRGQLVAWAIINDRQPKSKILFKIFGTGWPMPDDSGKYLKTLKDELGYVWHVFVQTDEEKVINEPSIMW